MTLQAEQQRKSLGAGPARARAAATATAPAFGAPPAVQRLEETRRALNARPEVVAQRAMGEKLSAAAAQRAPANRTGLPDGLKAGVESLSGVSMDDVCVHRNSARPAQLQAHACAQGTDIHLAPGQERHLPHEAWHVAQQKQRRVKPTMQLKSGVPVNDDVALEREADLMGARAVQLPAAGAAGTPGALAPPAGPDARPVIQRVLDPVPYPTNYVGPFTATYQAQVDAFRDQLNDLVDQAYEQSLHWQTLGGNDNALVRQWFNTAQAYAQNPDVEPRITSARFGYSIEAIATQALNNTVQHGLNISTQVGHGHTRPDVVAWVNTPDGRQEIAWFDITSAASIGHIRGKDGAGWRNRPFVYEIVYPQLRLRQLLDATDDPYYAEVGAMLADERQVDLDVKDANRAGLAEAFIALRDDKGWETGTENATGKRQITRDFFMAEAADEGVEEEQRSMMMTKGALIELGINPGPYGFNRGDVGSSNQRLNEVIDARSEGEIAERRGAVHAAASHRIIGELEESGVWPDLVGELYGQFWSDPASRETALETMALKGAIADLPRLNAIQDYLASYASDDPMWGRLAQEVEQQFKAPPLSHGGILAWRRHVRELERRTAGVRDVLSAREALHQYTVDHHLNFITWGPQIHGWFQRLSDYPPDVAAARQVTEWLATQPPVVHVPVVHAPAMNGVEPIDEEIS